MSDSGSPMTAKPKAAAAQCREMYRKMSAKGFSVSLDTIMRGMMTPTEYRKQKKADEEAEIARQKSIEEQLIHDQNQNI